MRCCADWATQRHRASAARDGPAGGAQHDESERVGTIGWVGSRRTTTAHPARAKRKKKKKSLAKSQECPAGAWTRGHRATKLNGTKNSESLIRITLLPVSMCYSSPCAAPCFLVVVSRAQSSRCCARAASQCPVPDRVSLVGVRHWPPPLSPSVCFAGWACARASCSAPSDAQRAASSLSGTTRVIKGEAQGPTSERERRHQRETRSGDRK